MEPEEYRKFLSAWLRQSAELISGLMYTLLGSLGVALVIALAWLFHHKLLEMLNQILAGLPNWTEVRASLPGLVRLPLQAAWLRWAAAYLVAVGTLGGGILAGVLRVDGGRPDRHRRRFWCMDPGRIERLLWAWSARHAGTMIDE